MRRWELARARAWRVGIMVAGVGGERGGGIGIWVLVVDLGGKRSKKIGSLPSGDYCGAQPEDTVFLSGWVIQSKYGLAQTCQSLSPLGLA